MLSRLEGIYLSILRVVILVIATVALIATGLGLAASLPLASNTFGLNHEDRPKPVQLSDYIAENRVDGAAIPEGVEVATDKVAKIVSSDIQTAGAIFTDYMNKLPGVNVQKNNVEDVLIERYNAEPKDQKASYASSLLDLSHQLAKSHGKKLGLDRLNKLINWHKVNFDLTVTAYQQRKDSEKAAAMFGVYVAGYSFLVFVSIIFCFIFIKIERNLRNISVVSDSIGQAG